MRILRSAINSILSWRRRNSYLVDRVLYDLMTSSKLEPQPRANRVIARQGVSRPSASECARYTIEGGRWPCRRRKQLLWAKRRTQGKLGIKEALYAVPRPASANFGAWRGACGANGKFYLNFAKLSPARPSHPNKNNVLRTASPLACLLSFPPPL